MHTSPSFSQREILLRRDGTSLYRAVGRDGRSVILEVGSPPREFDLVRGLAAPSVLRALERTVQDGKPTLVLEGFEGVPLRVLLGRPLPLERALRIAIRVAEALVELHDEGVIHKDITPDNVLVDLATDTAKLIGFGMATRSAREHPTASTVEFPLGSLPYMSPEQSGRMNRPLDHRSDFYSLGVTLYEVLTGRLPFEASDALEWVYCHVAREPAPPRLVAPGLPHVVSDIVQKLLAKHADDRYWTARGLVADLRRALDQWQHTGAIAGFSLGALDVSERLAIPERLYGREAELHQLWDSFDRVVVSGVPELAIVAGYSGVGKSSLVGELHRPLVAEHGIFVTGKADQYHREAPYWAMATAFRDLVLQALAASEAQLSALRRELTGALGEDARVLVDVIPELALLIGEPPPPCSLPPAESKRRFSTTFQKFVGVFAQKRHPLTLFIDDLHWADPASLELLQALLTNSETRYLLAIGAYRDNEVGSSHPLRSVVDEVRKTTRVSELRLRALSADDLAHLVADALHEPREATTSLARLVHDKTQGNPFFSIQFLSTLEHDGLLAFDRASRSWRWDVAKIESRDYADNVVELMVRKVAGLPEETRAICTLAACVGIAPELRTLTLIAGKPEDVVHRALEPAVREGLLLRTPTGYRFLHDRIQQAAYSLIADDARAAFHLSIGRSLLESTHSHERDFDLANHYLRALAAISDPSERLRAARIFCDAGIRAKDTLAYRSAVTFLAAGVGLLDEDGRWKETDFELGYALLFQLAECEWLAGDFDAALEIVPTLLTDARTNEQRLRARGLEVHLHIFRNELERATAAGLEGLRLVGVDWQPHPPPEQVRRAHDGVWALLGDRPIESLLDLPEMTDADMRAAIDLVSILYSAAHFYDWNLFCLLGCFAVGSSLRHGNAPSSFMGYGIFALIIIAEYARYEDAYRFGQVAYASLERPGGKPFVAKICEMVGAGCVNSWVKPYRTGLGYLERGAREGAAAFDLVWGSFCESHVSRTLFIAGEPLDEVARRSERALDYLARAKYEDLVLLHRALQNGIDRLRGSGSTTKPADTVGDDMSAFTRALVTLLDLKEACIFGDYERALQKSGEARQHLELVRGIIEEADFHFYSALALAAAHDVVGSELRPVHDAWLVEHEARFDRWAASCPENFAAQHALIVAEKARLAGKELEAEHAYERALAFARTSGLVHIEAMASEVAAKFHVARRLPSIATMYLRQAREAYARWGASGKVRELDRLHPELRETTALPNVVGRPDEMDLLGVIKASQTISGELDIEHLTGKLIEAVLEQTGAEVGRLLLLRDGEFSIECEAVATPRGIETKRQSMAAARSGLLPESVIRYVERTRDSVTLADAAAPGGAGRFIRDEYFARERPRSVLCVPIVRGARVAGAFYLENNLLAHAFSPERVASVELLAAQAAITVEAAFWIRQEREARTALEQSESRFRRLSDSKLIGIIVADRVGGIHEANDYFLEMLGYSREDLERGRLRWTELTPPEYAPFDAHALDELDAHGVCHPFEKEFVRRDGTRIPVLHGAAHLDGQRELSVGWVLDVSERRRAEAERDRLFIQEQGARAQAEAALRARDEFMSIAAHELRTPLTPLKMQIDLLGRVAKQTIPEGATGRAELLEMLESSSGQVTRLVALIGELLDVSTIRVGRLALSLESLDLVELVRGVVVRHRMGLEAAGSVVAVRATGELCGRWDRLRIEQVVANVLANAMKYGAGKPIEVEVAEDAGQACLTVRDRGIGIDESDRDRIFERFERAVPVRHFGGFGLGLYVTREIVRAHGGSIEIQSRPGAGSAFVVRLPLRPVPARLPSSPPDAPAAL